MYSQVITPRSSVIVTPEQLAAFGRFDVPEQYVSGSSPLTLTVDYALLQLFIEAATDQVEVFAATACLTETVLETYDFFPQEQDPRALLSYELSYAFMTPWWWYGSWPKESIELLRRPVQSVTSVTYFDENGVKQTWAGSNYTVAQDKICPNVGIGPVWPMTDRRQDCIQITYECGQTSLANVPSQLQLSILYLANHFWEIRSIVTVEPTSEVGRTLNSLLSSFRSARIPR